MKIGREALEPAHRLWITVWPHRHVMRIIAHIDSRGVGMDHFQTRILRLQPPRSFLPQLAIPPQLFVCPHPCLLGRNRIRFGPVTNGLRNSPTGSKGRYIQVLATRLVIASTGAMLTVGHETPCRISALVRRIESRDHTGKQGNSRQISGTSDASKTQLRLTRWELAESAMQVLNQAILVPTLRGK